jgi:hypothetical protein
LIRFVQSPLTDRKIPLCMRSFNMKRDLFIHLLRSEYITIIDTNSSNYDECILKDFRKLKSFIPFINFDCQITANGGCKETPESLKCCCFACNTNAGFFKVVLNTDLTWYARKFSVRTGFWRAGKGCILPHDRRSTTCLTHHCNYERKDDFSFGMMQLRNRLYHFREKMYPS